MAFDLLIKNGLIVDGSGMPAFRGDVGIKNGKIVEIGKLSGAATRTIDGVRHAICDILAAACRSRVVDLGSEPS